VFWKIVAQTIESIHKAKQPLFFKRSGLSYISDIRIGNKLQRHMVKERAKKNKKEISTDYKVRHEKRGKADKLNEDPKSADDRGEAGNYVKGRRELHTKERPRGGGEDVTAGWPG
jgi:uncharacterized membrane-anchored protein YjiN (DUF445 family)